MVGAAVACALVGSNGAAAQDGQVPVVEQHEAPPAQQPVPDGYQQQPQPQPPGYVQQPAYGPQPGYQGRRQRIEYHEGMPIPPGGEIVSRVRLGMLIPGLALFGVSYIGTLAAWAASEDAGGRIQDINLVPVVGPYIAASRADTQARKLGAAFMGVFQTVGLGLLIGGVVPKKYIVYYADGWQLTPRAGLDGAGLDFSMTF